MTTFSTPTFWDLHLHGVAGIDFMHASPDQMVHACENLGENGIGFFAPTLLTAEASLLREACSRWGIFLERIQKKNYLPRASARPLGLHLEGPFLNPAMAGAHPPKSLKTPSWGIAKDLLSASRGKVAIWTIAPELKGALPLISRLSKLGQRVQLGHSQATSKVASLAAKAGARGITHLHNAMKTHHRDPGLIAPLSQKLLTAEIITDGLHLDPTFVAWSVRAGQGQLYAVSDGCSAVGARKGTPLTLGDLKLKKNGILAVVEKTGTMAGGATYLTSHPQRLANCGLKHGELLELFYRQQQLAFSKNGNSSSATNHFDRKTLRFVGTEAHKRRSDV